MTTPDHNLQDTSRLGDGAGGDGRLAIASEALERINAELARLFGREPVKLVTGADESQRDPLVMCGLLGGKDVGKSTLINALAGREISVDRDEVGVGTSRPLVYVHREMIDTARTRLGGIEGREGVDLQFFPHQVDAVRNIVVVDLPDFDSDLARHEAVVQAVVPHLDRVIWVATPRKIADRAWVAFARDVVKADTNVYFALNKCDELLADEEGWPAPEGSAATVTSRHAQGFCRSQRQWTLRMLSEAGFELPPDRLFLVAAEYAEALRFVRRVGVIWDDPDWRQYGADRDVVDAIGRMLAADVGRLREGVLGPVDEAQAAEIKVRNLQAQVRQNARRLREEYEIEHWTQRLRLVLDVGYRQGLLNDAFGPEYCRTLAARLLRNRRGDLDLADEVMDVRAGRWPVLRVVYWLSRWAIRRVGRALTGPAWGRQGSSSGTSEEVFRYRSRSAGDRVESLLDRLRTEHAALVRRFSLQDRLPPAAELAGRIESDLGELPARGDEQLVDRLSAAYRPNVFGRLFVWTVLLWFPFVQPVAEGFLEMMAAGTRVLDWAHGLYRVVWALGAGQLLKGFAVVVGIYIACLAGIYARCVRDVHAAREGRGSTADGARAGRPDRPREIEALAEEIDQHLLAEVAGPAFTPFEWAAAELDRLSRQLHELSSEE